jgi:hypothetical protein
VQVSLGPNGKLAETLHIGDDTTNKIQPDLSACCRKSSRELLQIKSDIKVEDKAS